MTTVTSAVGARNRKSLPSTKSRLPQTASWYNSRPQVATFKIITAMPTQGMPRPVCLLSEVFQISGRWLSEQAQIYSVLRRFNEIIIQKMVAKSSCLGLVYTFFLWLGWYMQSRRGSLFYSITVSSIGYGAGVPPIQSTGQDLFYTKRPQRGVRGGGGGGRGVVDSQPQTDIPNQLTGGIMTSPTAGIGQQKKPGNLQVRTDWAAKYLSNKWHMVDSPTLQQYPLSGSNMYGDDESSTTSSQSSTEKSSPKKLKTRCCIKCRLGQKKASKMKKTTVKPFKSGKTTKNAPQKMRKRFPGIPMCCWKTLWTTAYNVEPSQ